jgi:rhodanese-related sulfurtransferase
MDAAAISAADLARLLEMSSGAERPLVVDVRRNAAFTASDDLIAGALRRDPEAVDRWSAELPKAASVAVYCVHGHEVSQAIARALRAQGLDARYIEHGLEGWRECGGRLAPKPAGGPTAWVETHTWNLTAST